MNKRKRTLVVVILSVMLSFGVLAGCEDNYEWLVTGIKLEVATMESYRDAAKQAYTDGDLTTKQLAETKKYYKRWHRAHQAGIKSLKVIQSAVKSGQELEPDQVDAAFREMSKNTGAAVDSFIELLKELGVI